MKEKITMMICSILLSLGITMSAYAGQWISDAYGWKWMNDDGRNSVNTWQWIDGNFDGIAESYYFESQGYCLTNTVTPDGYTVDVSGAWAVDGVVQIRQTAVQNQFQSNVALMNILELKPVDKKNFEKFASERTSQDLLWSDGFKLYDKSPRVEYYIGGKYTVLSLYYAPKEGMDSKYEGILKIYGDNEVLLWESDIINYKTSAQNISINVTGQQYVKFSLGGNRYGTVLFKDVLLQ